MMKKKEILFVRNDMRNFQIENKFGFIFIPGQSFQHLFTFEDVKNTLDSVKRHLNETGVLLIQIFTPSLSLLHECASKTSSIRKKTSKEWYVDPENSRMKFRATMDISYDIASQTTTTIYNYESENGEEKGILHLKMRQFFPQELDNLIR